MLKIDVYRILVLKQFRCYPKANAHVNRAKIANMFKHFVIGDDQRTHHFSAQATHSQVYKLSQTTTITTTATHVNVVLCNLHGLTNL